MMFRRLLVATTALALMGSGAVAGATDGVKEKIQSGAPISTTDTKDTLSGAPDISEAPGVGMFFQAAKDDILASGLTGMPVYDGMNDTARRIGDVNDVLMSSKGQAKAIVVGVGGFLGIGEKEVAVSFRNLEFTHREGEFRIVAEVTKDELKNAPAFDSTELEMGSALGGYLKPLTKNGDQKMMGDASAMRGDASAPYGASKTDAEGNGNSSNAMRSDDTVAALRATGPVDVSTMSANQLIGASVYSSKDRRIGEIGDILIGKDNRVEAYIVDVGGFLGIAEKPVALGTTNMNVVADRHGVYQVKTQFTEPELKSQTAYDAEAFRMNPDSVILR